MRPRTADGVHWKHLPIPALLSATLAMGWVACSPEPDAESGPAFEVVEATIDGVQAAIRDGTTTCREVVERHLARIAAYEDAINAITVLNPRALERADELDASLTAGEETGPLFCVPMLVKDNFDTHDMVTTGGSIALADNLPPRRRLHGAQDPRGRGDRYRQDQHGGMGVQPAAVRQFLLRHHA